MVCISLFLFGGGFFLQAQTKFTQITNFPTILGGKELKFPFLGGINGAQFNSIDLNRDGEKDLILFSPNDRRIIPFISLNGSLSYAPEYIGIFPKIQFSIKVADYNQDGIEDLFCGTSAGFEVYQGQLNGEVWNFKLISSSLKSKGFSGLINIFGNNADVPAIYDIDEDGDLDFILFNLSGHTLELHQNYSMERTGKADLDFEKVSSCFGNLAYFDCGNIVTSTDCNLPFPFQVQRPKFVLHSGNTIHIIPSFENGKPELYLGSVNCDYLTRISLDENDAYTKVDYQFPDQGENQFYIPLAFPFKGDLIISSNDSEAELPIDHAKTVFRYSPSPNGWTLQENNFLQNEMVDYGKNNSTAFFDYDSDGKKDLVSTDYASWLYLLKNVGSNQNPVFEEKPLVSPLGKLLVRNGQVLAVDDQLFFFFSLADNIGVRVLGKNTENILNPDVSFILPNEPLSMNDWDGNGKPNLFVRHFSGEFDEYEFDGKSFNLIKENWGQNAISGMQTIIHGDFEGKGEEAFLGNDFNGNIYLGKYGIEENLISWTKLENDLIGLGAKLFAADWNEDGILDFGVSSINGGILMYQNQASGPDIPADSFLVWPNPSKGEIYIRSKENAEFEIVDISGRLIQSGFVGANKIEKIRIDQSGVYLIRIGDKTERVLVK